MDAGTIGALIGGAMVAIVVTMAWLFVRGIGEVLGLAKGHKETR